MAYVYRHIRLDKNEPFYIGIGKTEKRALDKRNRSNFWNNIVSKTDYEIDVLFNNLSWDEAVEKEKEFIKLYGRIDLNNGTLVNLTNGGDGTFGYIFSNNHKKLIGEANKKRVVSNETKLKISNSNKGRKLTPEQYLNHIEVVKNRKVLKGELHPNFGKKMDEKQKAKLRGKRNILAWNSGIKRTDINGEKHGMAKIVLNTQSGIYYEYCKDASKWENISYTLLSQMLTGKRFNKTNLIYV